VVAVMSLWLPILVSAVIVFVVSSIIHMVLPYHRNDFGKVPAEDEVMDALRKFEIPPGEYVVPRAGTPKEMGTPEFAEKTKKGPVLFMTVLPNGPMAMGASLVQWFVYSIVVGIFAAYSGSSPPTSRGVRWSPGPITWRCSASPDAWPSWATPSPSGRTRSGTNAPGARRSSRASTVSCTRC